ncbi:MAG: acetamidase/formamidase family protein, partial [Alkalicoccus sp.]
IDLKVEVIKGGMEKFQIKSNPVFRTSPVEPHYTDYIVFEGVSVNEHNGKQHYLDAHLAYRRACLNAIDYMKTLGYTGEQAYMLLSTAPVEGRVSGIVDIPNACCTVAIPKDIFDKDPFPESR